MCAMCVKPLQLCPTLWPHGLWPTMGLFRQECWSGLPCSSPGDLRYPGFKPGTSTLQADSLPSEPWGMQNLKNIFKILKGRGDSVLTFSGCSTHPCFLKKKMCLLRRPSLGDYISLMLMFLGFSNGVTFVQAPKHSKVRIILQAACPETSSLGGSYQPCIRLFTWSIWRISLSMSETSARIEECATPREEPNFRGMISGEGDNNLEDTPFLSFSCFSYFLLFPIPNQVAFCSLPALLNLIPEQKTKVYP